MCASGNHARFPGPVEHSIHAPILQKCRFPRFVYPLTKEKSRNIMSGYFLIKQGQGRSVAMVWWIESIDRDALLFFHSLFQSLKTLLGGLLNEGHVFSEMLLSVDFSFLTPLQLVQSEL